MPFESAHLRDISTKTPLFWLELARKHIQANAIAAARLALRRASELASSSDCGIVLQIADTAKQLGDHAFAVKLYDLVLSIADDHPGARLALASSLERLNRLEEAIEQLDRLSERHRSAPPAMVLQAKLQRRRRCFEDALETLNQLQHRFTNLPPAFEINASHERFVVLDGMEAFDSAFAALRRTKELNLALAGPERIAAMQQAKRQSYHRLLSIIRIFDPADLDRWKAAIPQSRLEPPAFFLGHPRSGTTLLENILESHSGVISSDERPVLQFHAIDPITAKFRPPEGSEEAAQQAFLTHLDELPLKSILGYRSAYFKELEALMEKPLNNFLLLDKNPAITDGALFALRTFPHAKFLFAQRDPRAVVWSAFTLPMLDTSWIGAFWFDLETTAEAYAMLTDLWLEFREKLPESQSLTVRYESVVENTLKEGQRATAFLGLEWESAQEQFHTHAQQKQVRSPTYADVVKPVYTKALEHWRNYEGFMARAIPHLERHLDLFGYSRD